MNPDVRNFEVHSRKTAHAYSDGCLHHVSAVISTCLLVDSIVEGGEPTLELVTTAASKKIKDCLLDLGRLREGLELQLRGLPIEEAIIVVAVVTTAKP